MSFIEFEQAVNLLKQNEVVAFPTETVYGLGAKIDSDAAIKKIFTTKQRPFFDPLIVHVDSVAQAKTLCRQWPKVADFLTKKFWPGPLTLVLSKNDLVSDLITSGLENVGLRLPKHPLAQKLIQAVGVPIAAPSANRFGRTSPTLAEHVESEFNSTVPVLKDSNQGTEFGIESTVLLIQDRDGRAELSILRKGSILKSAIDAELLAQQFKDYIWKEQVDKKFSPGQMKHHYMPNIPFVICTNPQMKLSELSELIDEKIHQLSEEVDGVKIVKPEGKIHKIEFLKLSDQADQAAREIYAKLRQASDRKPQALCFIRLGQHQGEMWESVLDRLYKAASLVL